MRALALCLALAACAPEPDDDVSEATDELTCAKPYTRWRATAWYEKPRVWTPDVQVGAIRYDAWSASDEGNRDDLNGNSFELPNVMFRILPEWFARAPFYTTFADGVFHAAQENQKVADAQIDYAYARGIDYFAFLYSRFVTRDYLTGAYRSYDQLHNLHAHWHGAYGLDRYHASSRCHRPRFSLIVQADIIKSYVRDWNAAVDPAVAWGHVVGDIVQQYQRPNVHTTPDGRPILFVFAGLSWKDAWNGDIFVARARMNDLRNAFVAAGLPPPYLVTLDFSPDHSAQAITETGYDAASVYAHASPPTTWGLREYPFDQLRNDLTWYRNRLAALNVPMIPSASMGWDARPLEAAGREPYTWFSHATPAEIVAQLNEVIGYVRANPARTPANSVLVYAWNENGEGGFLEPTLREGSARLDAIAAARRLKIPPEVPVRAPVVRPAVQNIASFCDEDGSEYGVWIEAANLDPDAIIQVRPAAITGYDEPFYTYTAPSWPAGNQLQICFATQEERDAHDGAGVRVHVINPSRRSASEAFLLHRGDDW